MIRQVGAGLWTLAARRLARAPEGRADHPRGDRRDRRPGDADAGAQPGRAVAAQRAATTRSTSCSSSRTASGADMVLAMTHEEVVTTHVAQVVRSYRDLPLILYHFQIKERDEPRPRAGVLRTREFIMKDSYTFDRDARGARRAATRSTASAYDRIFDRCGLEWYRVESDVGMMGGTGAHEYMAPCPAGENDVALAPGYAANVEVATRRRRSRSSCPTALDAPEEVDDAGPDDGRARSRGSSACPPARCSRPIRSSWSDRGLRARAGARRPPRQRHQARATRSAPPSGPRRRRSSPSGSGPAGYIGPVGTDVPILLDDALDARRLHHRRQPRRRAPARRRARAATSRSSASTCARVEAGDTVDGHAIRIEPAIEIGNIFKLGTRYSEPLGATYLDESGVAQPIWMGSYGIGPARIAAAAVEQFADEKGISWPRVARAVRRAPRRARQAGHRGARAGRAALRRAAGGRPGRHLRRSRRRAGREVRRRRAARRARCG